MTLSQTIHDGRRGFGGRLERLRVAWHVLRGRGTVYRVQVTVRGEHTHIASTRGDLLACRGVFRCGGAFADGGGLTLEPLGGGSGSVFDGRPS